MGKIRTRLTLLFTALLLISFAGFSIWVYQQSVNIITKAVGTQAETEAKFASKLLNPTELEEIHQKIKDGVPAEEIMKDPLYQKMNQSLIRFRKETGLNYVFTMLKVGDEYFYGVDGHPSTAKDDFSAPGTPETIEYEELIKSFQTKEPRVGNVSNDHYGSNITSYVPVFTKDGTFIGVVGADWDATNVYEYLVRFKIIITIISFLISVFLAIVTYSILSTQFSQPIRLLGGTLNKLKQGNLELFSYSKKDEIGTLGNSLNEAISRWKGTVAEADQERKQVSEASHSIQNTTNAVLTETEQMHRQLSQLQTEIHSFSGNWNRSLSTLQNVQNSLMLIPSLLQHVFDAFQQTKQQTIQYTDSLRETSKTIESFSHMHMTVEQSVEQTEHHSYKVKEVIGTLSDLMERTELLALNADIEAEKSGIHGASFSVIAQEIKQLSLSSRSHLLHVSKYIDGFLHSFSDTVSFLRNYTEEMNKMIQTMQITSDSVQTATDGIQLATQTTETVRNSSLTMQQDLQEMSDVWRSLYEQQNLLLSIADSVQAASQSQYKQFQLFQQVSEQLFMSSSRLEDSLAFFKTSPDK